MNTDRIDTRTVIYASLWDQAARAVDGSVGLAAERLGGWLSEAERATFDVAVGHDITVAKSRLGLGRLSVRPAHVMSRAVCVRNRRRHDIGRHRVARVFNRRALARCSSSAAAD